jgi:hypothetical protein
MYHVENIKDAGESIVIRECTTSESWLLYVLANVYRGLLTSKRKDVQERNNWDLRPTCHIRPASRSDVGNVR